MFDFPAVTAPLNACLNYLLVWGPEPIRLGFAGAPTATAISMNVMVRFIFVQSLHLFVIAADNEG